MTTVKKFKYDSHRKNANPNRNYTEIPSYPSDNANSYEKLTHYDQLYTSEHLFTQKISKSIQHLCCSSMSWGLLHR